MAGDIALSEQYYYGHRRLRLGLRRSGQRSGICSWSAFTAIITAVVQSARPLSSKSTAVTQYRPAARPSKNNDPGARFPL